jgi:hypothetical protein
MLLSPLGERLGEGVMQEMSRGEKYESFANRKAVPPSCQP